MSNWISVKDKLPEKDQQCLCFYGFGNNPARFYGVLDYYATDPEPHFQHAGMGLIVTHWMSLPAPPEGVNEDGHKANS